MNQYLINSLLGVGKESICNRFFPKNKVVMVNLSMVENQIQLDKQLEAINNYSDDIVIFLNEIDRITKQQQNSIQTFLEQTRKTIVIGTTPTDGIYADLINSDYNLYLQNFIKNCKII